MIQDKKAHDAHSLNQTGEPGPRPGAYHAGTYDEDSEGLSITQEQVNDVYKAGTSDGILILEGGVIVNLKEDR